MSKQSQMTARSSSWALRNNKRNQEKLSSSKKSAKTRNISSGDIKHLYHDGSSGGSFIIIDDTKAAVVPITGAKKHRDAILNREIEVSPRVNKVRDSIAKSASHNSGSKFSNQEWANEHSSSNIACDHFLSQNNRMFQTQNYEKPSKFKSVLDLCSY